MTVLGVDWGRARVGVAVSDELELIAHPLSTLAAGSLETVARELAALARARAAREVVLGLPLNMDGSEGDSARAARQLAERLRVDAGLPVTLWDERLSTWEAERRLGETRRAKKRGEPGLRDRAAAAVILQSYLDSRKRAP
jgi:putative Holliday junction resolvase